MNKTLEDLGLSVRTYNAVKRYGITTVDELSERIDEFCGHSPKFGAEAREAIEKLGSAPVQSTAQVLSSDYTKAVSLHRKICVSAELAEQNLFEMCKGLCEMRDYKLYRELGYSSFEDYCTQELKISLRQGQKYAAIASLETIGNAKSTSHFEKLGTEKLYLLSRIEEDARIEIMEKTDLENTSVRELKAKIAELKRDIKTQQDNYSMHTKRREDEIAKLQSQLGSMTADRDQEKEWREELVTENGKQSDRISELIAQLDELETRPVEVVAKPDEEIIKAHLREIDSLQRQHKEELDELRDTYQKQMNEGIAKARKEAQAPDIGELWRALDTALDNAIEAIEDFFDDYDSHPKIKNYANALKKTARDLNTMVNNVLAGEGP